MVVPDTLSEEDACALGRLIGQLPLRVQVKLLEGMQQGHDHMRQAQAGMSLMIVPDWYLHGAIENLARIARAHPSSPGQQQMG